MKTSIYLIAFYAIITTLGLTSCGENDNEIEGIENSNLIGKWKPYKFADHILTDYNSIFSECADDILEFKENGIVTYDENSTYYGGLDKPCYDSYITSFILIGDELTIESPYCFLFAEKFKVEKISENELIINNGLEYYFKRIK